MSVEFTDILQLPKHRGKTVQQVFDKEPSYLLWLRDTKLGGGRSDYFDPTVLKALNGVLARDKKLAARFKPWTELKDGRFSPVAPTTAAAMPSTPSATPPWQNDDDDRRPSLAEINEAQERQRVYAESWGSF